MPKSRSRRRKPTGPPEPAASEPRGLRPMLSDRNAWIVVLGVAGLALVFRLFRLGQLPPGLWPDEAVYGVDVFQSLGDAGFRVFYDANYGREGLILIPQAISILLLGPTEFALRLPSAIAGTLSVIVAFVFVRKMLRVFLPSPTSLTAVDPNLAGVLAAFLVATSRWHVTLSRMAYRANLVPLLAPLALLLFTLALRRRSLRLGLAAGVITGLGLYTYAPFRFLVFPLLFIAAWDGLTRHRSLFQAFAVQLRSRVLQAYAAVVVVVATPLAHVAITRPESFFGRSTSISVWNTYDPWGEFLTSLDAALSMFLTHGDLNQRHNIPGEPVLQPILMPLFVAGLILIAGAVFLSITPLRKSPSSRWLSDSVPPAFGGLLLLWQFVMLLPAAVTTDGRPHVLRSIGAIPPAYIITALGALFLLRTLTTRFSVELARLSAACVLVPMAVSVTYTTWDRYFHVWAGAREMQYLFYPKTTEFGHRIDEFPLEPEKIVVVGRASYGVREKTWEVQPIVYLAELDTAEKRAAKNVRFVTIADLELLEHSTDERVFFLTNVDEADVDAVNAAIERSSPNARIER